MACTIALSYCYCITSIYTTVEQGSYSKLCASLALPIFQLLAYCNSIQRRHTNRGYAQVHSLFIYLLVGGADIKWEGHFGKNTLLFYFHVDIFSHHPHALHSDNFLDEKQEIITTLALS